MPSVLVGRRGQQTILKAERDIVFHSVRHPLRGSVPTGGPEDFDVVHEARADRLTPPIHSDSSELDSSKPLQTKLNAQMGDGYC